MVRCFEDENVTHVSESVDPVRDIETINTELALADMDTIAKAIDRVNRVAKSGDKEAIAQMNFLKGMQAHIDQGLLARTFAVPDDQRRTVAELHLLTMKPVLYVANVAEDGFEGNAKLDAVQSVASAEGAELVAICNKLEAEIAELEAEEKHEFLAEIGMVAVSYTHLTLPTKA